MLAFILPSAAYLLQIYDDYPEQIDVAFLNLVKTISYVINDERMRGYPYRILWGYP